MLFSVIIPIYNVEKYLRECLDSVARQTFPDFEAILVDDGSPDGSAAICNEYAARDSRFTVIHKKNGGLVSARKAGIICAGGEYIVNLDGDDRLRTDMLENAKKIIDAHHPDVLSFAVDFFPDSAPTEKRTVREPLEPGFYGKNELYEKIYPQMLMTRDMRHSFYYLCAKAIKRSVLYAPQLAVDDGISLGEDVTCLMNVYAACESVYISEKSAYECRERQGSDSRLFKPAQFDQLIRGVTALEKMRLPEGSGFAAQTDRYTAFLCFGLINAATLSKRKDARKIVCANLKNETLRQHIQAAEFESVTPKMRVVYRLLKKGRIKTLFSFLKLCNLLKNPQKR